MTHSLRKIALIALFIGFSGFTKCTNPISNDFNNWLNSPSITNNVIAAKISFVTGFVCGIGDSSKYSPNWIFLWISEFIIRNHLIKNIPKEDLSFYIEVPSSSDPRSTEKKCLWPLSDISISAYASSWTGYVVARTLMDLITKKSNKKEEKKS